MFNIHSKKYIIGTLLNKRCLLSDISLKFNVPFLRKSFSQTNNNYNATKLDITSSKTDAAVIDHKEFLDIADSVSNIKQIPKEKIYFIKKYLQANDVLGKPDLNRIIAKISLINNIELSQALEASLKTKIRTADVIQQQAEKDSFDNFVRSRGKLKRIMLFNIKFFLCAILISTLYRVYYYIEHDIDILEPRVSSYHIYRFR